MDISSPEVFVDSCTDLRGRRNSEDGPYLQIEEEDDERLTVELGLSTKCPIIADSLASTNSTNSAGATSDAVHDSIEVGTCWEVANCLTPEVPHSRLFWNRQGEEILPSMDELDRPPPSITGPSLPDEKVKNSAANASINRTISREPWWAWNSSSFTQPAFNLHRETINPKETGVTTIASTVNACLSMNMDSAEKEGGSNSVGVGFGVGVSSIMSAHLMERLMQPRTSLHGKALNFRVSRNETRYRKMQARTYNFLERPKTWLSIAYHVAL
ncbi:unnamed protein product [Protopolystoma xenopodis]|uniref:Uncharacterized protein n=1 Tax=Protopolystoma xenopodis TaxID=117903 RepID=A0A3S5BX81_9PLAT|nr:unnamed protein product [Protopolystoma xenopodis]